MTGSRPDLVPWDPYAPAADLVPWDTEVATPSDAEERTWREACAAFYHEMRWLPRDVRIVWFAGGDGHLFGQTLHTTPTVIQLMAGRRRLEDLRRTALHELRHAFQMQFSEDAWSPEEREADATDFAVRMMARG